MTTKNIIEGLTILEKYRKGENGYNTGAEHDQLYAYATDEPVNKEDLERLVELGWWQEEVETEDEDGDFAVTDYDPEEGWTCFV